ncbi:MAG: type II secretion system secretin GspD [Chromatiales bacterium]|nr:type II secretion system secretin GspD [Chromatiales bacterium]
MTASLSIRRSEALPFVLRKAIAVILLALWSGLSWAEAMTLNLKDADINTVISTVSEMTGKNFIVDPRVKGKVTIVSSQPMEAEDIYQVFLTVLNVHGFAAVPGKNVVKIVPEVNAKQDAIPTVTWGKKNEDGQFVTRVVTVKNVSAAQLVPVLRPLLPQEAHLAAYTPTNVLIVSATSGNIDRIVGLVRRIDLSSESEVELIPMKHASASEVERILNSLEQGGAAKAAGGGVDEVKVIADGRSNSLLLSGDKTKRHHLKKIIEQLDTPLQTSGNTRVFYLRYAKATDLADVLNGVGKSLIEEKGGAAPAARAPAAGTGLNIQADEATNALVINASPDVLRDLETVIRQLDVRRAQVLVQAVIAEVGADQAMELGIQWGFDGSANNAPVGLIDFNDTITGVASTVVAAQAGVLTAPPSLNGLTVAAGTFSGSAFNFAGILRALGGDSNNNILSTPSLVTMDNEEAEIVVGQTVPFLTGSYSSTGGGTTPDNPFQTIQREDVGLSLKIKPQINEGDAIRMEISQEVSSISGSTVNATDLITNKRSVKTTVMVDDGQVLVLGGLIEDQLVETEQKVPLLGDIPLLGWFFRYQKNIKSKKDLMVFIHPRIMRDGKFSSALSTEKYNYIRAEQLKIREEGLRLMSDEASPLLPEMEEFLKLPPPYMESTRAIEANGATATAVESSITAKDSLEIPPPPEPVAVEGDNVPLP